MNLPFHLQRHTCLEAARRVLRTRAAYEALWKLHCEALQQLFACGASIEGPQNWAPARRQVAERESRVKLPTEDAATRASYDMQTAWKDFCDTLARYPAVQAEVFAMLGAGE